MTRAVVQGQSNTDNLLSANNILNLNQYGFRTNMSTHAVMELTEEISDAKDSKQFAVGVFIDLKRLSIQ